MLNSRLEGPFRLNVDGIDLAIRRRSAGTFALGGLDRQGRFCLSRVGRADHDLSQELRNFIGSESLFKFAYARDGIEAFLKECELFHRFRPQANFWHPTRPEGTRILCPYCLNSRVDAG
jgi:hypothetical protein